MSGRKKGKRGIPCYEDIRRILSDGKAVHFVGIGGVSMYSLARLALVMGVSVSGSDREGGQRTDTLLALGARIFTCHSGENIIGADLVVYSHAIGEDNPELRAARTLGIPTVNRAEFLGAIMLDYKRRIGVSGSHGKSTTVAMLEAIFTAALADPTVLSGAELVGGEPYRLGSFGNLIYESCEFCDSFLHFCPTIALALNMELDHTDYFSGIEMLSASFEKALGRATDFAILSGDDRNLRGILPGLSCRAVTFGRGRDNDYRYDITDFCEGNFTFDIYKFDNKVGSFSLHIPGVFNVHNATAAIAVALEVGIEVEVIRSAIAAFRGIPRRLERIGSVFGREVYYDYAHHPTEIMASLTAIKGLTNSPVTLLFKPHTYSRTRDLWEDTRRALSLADYPIVCDIYPARESPVEGITAERLAAEVTGGIYLPDRLAAEYIIKNTSGTIVLMGAGDLTDIKMSILR